MVARILENERYTGKAGYPALISSEQFETVAEKRSKKVSPISKDGGTKAPAAAVQLQCDTWDRELGDGFA